jgi:chemosensory pili system protein ChpA (sensor histidine kinase/response regulator)
MAQPSILIVDDDLDQLSILGAMLSNFSYNVITALNGVRALEMLHEQVPAMVITDMVMPDVSGSDIVHAIRADSRLDKTKVVIITSLLKYVSDDDKKLADKVLLKPIQKKDLEAMMKDLLG